MLMGKGILIGLHFFSLALANCFVEAAKYYKVNPYILWSIAKVESNLNPYAVEVISKKPLPLSNSLTAQERKLANYPFTLMI